MSMDTRRSTDDAGGLGVLAAAIVGASRFTWWVITWAVVCWPWTLAGIAGLVAYELVTEGTVWGIILSVALLAGAVWMIKWSWAATLQDWRAHHMKARIFRDFRTYAEGLITRRGNILVREGATPGVYKVVLASDPGHSDDEIVQHFPVLASDLGANVFHVPDSKNDGVIEARVITRDLLAKPLTSPAPVIAEPPATAHDWVTIGIDNVGESIKLPLFLRKAGGCRMFIAGAAGSGKSSPLSQLVAGAVLSDAFDVWIADPKQSDFRWASSAVARYETDPDAIVTMLEELRELARDRQQQIANTGHQVWSAEEHGRPLVVVLEEMTTITTGAGGLDRKRVNAACDAFVDLTSRARSAGITILAVTQQLSTDAVPSMARSNFDIRIAMSVVTNTDAEMVIPGSSHGPDSFNPAKIGGTYRQDGSLTTAGVFVLGGMFQTKGRSYFIPTTELNSLVNR